MAGNTELGAWLMVLEVPLLVADSRDLEGSEEPEPHSAGILFQEDWGNACKLIRKVQHWALLGIEAELLFMFHLINKGSPKL